LHKHCSYASQGNLVVTNRWVSAAPESLLC